MAVSMVGIHFFASSEDKAYSLAGALFMFLMTGITSCVHFVILIFSYQLPADRLANLSSVLSFKWPSVAYALDILAWDWFYAISVLLAAQVFKHGKLERTTRMLMIVSGVLGLFGLVCVSLQKMQIRNIGIIGYAVIGPVSFLLISKILHGQQYTIGKKKA
jgi:hypothetical protein